MMNKLLLIGLLTFGLACSSGIAVAADAADTNVEKHAESDKSADHKGHAKADKASHKHKHHKNHKHHDKDHKHHKHAHDKACHKHEHKHKKHHTKKQHGAAHSDKRANQNVNSSNMDGTVVSGTPPEDFEGVRESQEGQMSDRSYND